MPIYEYRCRNCGHEFETIQKVNARPLRKCPECSGRLEKLISRAAFQLKGGGWFAQDYGKSPTGKTTADASSDSKAGSKPEPKSKPAAASKD